MKRKLSVKAQPIGYDGALSVMFDESVMLRSGDSISYTWRYNGANEPTLTVYLETLPQRTICPTCHGKGILACTICGDDADTQRNTYGVNVVVCKDSAACKLRHQQQKHD